MNCGVVNEQQLEIVHNLPFEETYGNKAEIPIHQIRTIATIFDPPLIHKMKEYAENLREESGMD